jgi:hypothetical protein
MQLRALIGTHAGQIRDYSPVAARGALASGVAELVHVDRPRQVETAPVDRFVSEKPKTTSARRKV